MPLRKTAIAISDELLSAVDSAAEARGESRNRFVTRVLEEAVRARSDAEVTLRLNDLFADPELAQEQARTANELDAVVERRGPRRWVALPARHIECGQSHMPVSHWHMGIREFHMGRSGWPYEFSKTSYGRRDSPMSWEQFYMASVGRHMVFSSIHMGVGLLA